MARISVVGLGYVGHPLALKFDEAGHDVWGYDIDEAKIRELERGGSTDELRSKTGRRGNVVYTARPSCISECDYVVVTVPTPLDGNGNPDLRNVRAAARTVGRHLSPKSTIVLESTVYPGATRNAFVPELEAASGMTAGEDFSVGYSPERVVPGDESHDIGDVTKIVSGYDEHTARNLEAFYSEVIDAGVHVAPDIETAEAAKCLENVQRDVNIALINEFAMGCSQFGRHIDPDAVLEAAATKWNFHEYHPGLVGGHCLPVDPHYLAHAFEQYGFTARLMRRAREVNERFAMHVAERTLELLARRRDRPVANRETVVDGGTVTAPPRRDESILLLGLAYKRNSSDVRNPPARTVISELERGGVEPIGFDPHVSAHRLESTFDIAAREALSGADCDGAIVLTPHAAFDELDVERLRDGMGSNPVLVDVTGVVDEARAGDCGFTYWRVGA